MVAPQQTLPGLDNLPQNAFRLIELAAGLQRHGQTVEGVESQFVIRAEGLDKGLEGMTAQMESLDVQIQ